MPVPKYQKFYELMVAENQSLFDKFQAIHDEFVSSGKNEDAFHAVGRDVKDIMYFWERKLCQGMERGAHGVYSQKVADKFWDHIKQTFTHIDQVGVFRS